VRRFALIILLGLLTPAQVNRSYGASFEDGPHVLADSSAQLANQVVQWNRTLLVILRTPGAAGHRPPNTQLRNHARCDL